MNEDLKRKIKESILASNQPLAIFSNLEERRDILVINFQHVNWVIGNVKNYVDEAGIGACKSLKIWQFLYKYYSFNIHSSEANFDDSLSIINTFTLKINKLREQTNLNISDSVQGLNLYDDKDIIKAFAQIPRLVAQRMLEDVPIVKIDEKYINSNCYTYNLFSLKLLSYFPSNEENNLRKFTLNLDKDSAGLITKRADFSISMIELIKDLYKKEDKICQWVKLFSSPLEIWFLCEVGYFILNLHESGISVLDKGTDVKIKGKCQIASENIDSINLLQNPDKFFITVSEKAKQEESINITILDVFYLTLHILARENITYVDSSRIEYTTNPTRNRSPYQIFLKRLKELTNYSLRKTNPTIKDLASEDGGITVEARSSIVKRQMRRRNSKKNS